MNEPSLNRVYSRAWMRRRYEVWFLRLGLADASGAWWFRYLLMNLGRAVGGCPGNPAGFPVQVWATWFPRGGKPESFIQGFSKDGLLLSRPGASPLRLGIASNRIGEDSCSGRLEVEGHVIAWDLRCRSSFGTTLSDKGWIGFSRTPHSDAVFSGEITFDGRSWRGDPLGYGVQGHNCGYRHRKMWNWAHAIFREPRGNGVSAFEALEYEMPLGLRFRKALLWHGSRVYTFRKVETVLRDCENMGWAVQCTNRSEGFHAEAVMDGRGECAHRLPYLKTDCSGSFVVANNSLARASLSFSRRGQPPVELCTETGAVLELVGH